MAALDERLDKAEEMIAKPSFRENKGLGNEVGYYIFDYMPKDELIVRKRVGVYPPKTRGFTGRF